MTSNIKRSKFKKKSDKVMEKEAVVEESVSVFVLSMVVILWFMIAVGLGMYLYDIAMNNGAIIVGSLLNIFF